jgi:hypothetical protein
MIEILSKLNPEHSKKVEDFYSEIRPKIGKAYDSSRQRVSSSGFQNLEKINLLDVDESENKQKNPFSRPEFLKKPRNTDYLFKILKHDE